MCGHKAGEFYSHSDVDANVNKIKDFIGYTGCNANVQVREVYDPEMPGVVTIEYNVEQDPPAIFTVGLELTRQSQIHQGPAQTHGNKGVPLEQLKKPPKLQPEPDPYKDLLKTLQDMGAFWCR